MASAQHLALEADAPAVPRGDKQQSDSFRWVLVAGGLVLLVTLFARLGPVRIVSLLVSLRGNFLIIAGLFASHECLRALAVSLCLSPGHRPRFRKLLRIRFLGEAAGTLTRTGQFLAEPARAWMLARQVVHGAHAYGAAASELIANSTVSALITILAIEFALRPYTANRQVIVLSQVILWISVGYVVLAIAALATRFYLIGAILRFVNRLPYVGERLRTDPAQVRQVEDAIMRALTHRPATIAQILFLELLAQTILVAEIYWTIHSMRQPISAGTALLVEALTKAANVIQFVGATEAGYAVVLDWLGLTAAVGFALSLVKLLRSLTVVGIGLALLKQLDRS